MSRNLVPTMRRTAALLALAGGLLAGQAQAQTPMPGTVQAETYASMSGVVIEPTTDTGGGFNVGHTDNNDWMRYPVNVPTSGAYTVQFRVAQGSRT
ncbi:carbohydrate-binding protein [Telluria sp. Tellsp131]